MFNIKVVPLHLSTGVTKELIFLKECKYRESELGNRPSSAFSKSVIKRIALFISTSKSTPLRNFVATGKKHDPWRSKEHIVNHENGWH